LARFPFVPILSSLTGTEPIIVILWKEIDCLVLAELHHSRKIEFDQYSPSVQIVVMSDSHFWSGASALKFRFNRLAQQISNRDAFNIFGQQLISLVSIQNRSMFSVVIATAWNRCHATTDQANGELISLALIMTYFTWTTSQSTLPLFQKSHFLFLAGVFSFEPHHCSLLKLLIFEWLPLGFGDYFLNQVSARSVQDYCTFHHYLNPNTRQDTLAEERIRYDWECPWLRNCLKRAVVTAYDLSICTNFMPGKNGTIS
jgi:hypothetical protein